MWVSKKKAHDRKDVPAVLDEWEDVVNMKWVPVTAVPLTVLRHVTGKTSTMKEGNVGRDFMGTGIDVLLMDRLSPKEWRGVFPRKLVKHVVQITTNERAGFQCDNSLVQRLLQLPALRPLVFN